MDNGLKHLLFPLLLTAVFHPPAFSQDMDERMRERNRLEWISLREENASTRSLREVREAFVKEHMDASLAAIDPKQIDPAEADRNFLLRVPQFRAAVEKYRTSMGVDPSPTKSLKEIDRFVDAFKTYFEQTHVDAPVVDVAEFTDFSRKDLLWETLTSAERVDTQLRQAALLVNDARISNVTTVKSMLFLRTLHGEIRRLDLLISKVK
jgi:hypothetical protein